MLRKVSIQALVFLLIALPVLGTFANDSQAAASSRVAIISDMSGDVQVQKSGGSKKIRAFKKLNLNQGDMLLTGSNGSATLQFSNGTSSDDTMTVDADTTLKFSKLTSKDGTVTKVSMLKGTAWSDVKSIQNKDDEFQVETPTAIMGVRGTNFLVTVNPLSGTTNTSVFAGIVEVAPPGTILGSGQLPNAISLPTAPGTVISGSTPGSILVYPTNQIIMSPNTNPGELSSQVSIVNLELLAPVVSPSILQAIIQSKQKIDEENQQLLEKLKGGGLPEQLGSNLDVVGANFENLIGALINQIVSSGSIPLEEINKILQKAQEMIGQIIEFQNKVLIISQIEKAKQELLKQKEQQLQELERQKKLKQQQAEDQLLEKLKKEKDKQNQENAAKLEQIKKAIEEQKNPTSPTTPTTPSNPAPSSDAKLSGLTLSDGVLSPAFHPDTASYTVNVSNDVAAISVTPTAAGASSVKVNGTAAANGAGTSVPLSLGSNTITVLVTAQDGTTTKTYTLTVNRALITQIGLSFGNGSLAINPDQDEYDLGEFTNEDSSFTLSLPNDGTTYTVRLNGQEVLPGVIRLAALEDPEWDAPLEYRIQLAPGNNAIQLTTSLNGYSRTYTFNAHLEEEVPSNNASLSDIKINGESLEGFESNVAEYSLVVPYTTTNLEVVGIAADSAAQVAVKGGSELQVGSNEVTIAVTAADGVTKRTYTITVTREAAASEVSLSELALSDGVTLTPGFSPTILEYTAKVNNDVTKISVTPYAVSTSKLTVNGGAAQSGLPVPVTLNSSGDTVITVVVTAQNGQKQTYSITVERKSSEASLSGLSVEGYELIPMEGNSYSVRIPASEESLKLSYLLSENASAIVTVNGEATGDVVTLEEGENTIRIEITSEDGTNEDLYVIFVERFSSDSKLGELSVSGYSLSPEFSPDIEEYTLSVPYSETIVTVDYWLWNEMSEAVLKVNGVVAESPTVTLAAGDDNLIEIAVTSEDGSSTTTYTITVTRNAASSDASLTGLMVSEGTFSPSFDASILDYTVKVEQGVELLYVTASAAATSKITINGGPAQSGLQAKVTLNAEGSTTIPVIVTSEDAVTTKEYTITVLHKSSVSTLSGLSVEGYDFDTPFSSSVTDYTIQVANDVEYVNVSFTASDSNAGVRLLHNGSDAGGQVTLDGERANIIEVVVTSEDESSTKTYTITVERHGPEARLGGLSVSGGVLSPDFSPTTTSYTMSVGNEVASIVVTPFVDGSEMLTVNDSEAASGVEVTVPLEVGLNTITIVVTAEDGETTETYTITVTRQAPLPEGVLSWTTTANESTVNWILVDENSDDSFVKYDYVLSFESAPATFEVNFGFDSNVVDVDSAELEAFDTYFDLSQGYFAIQQDQWHDGENEATVYYNLKDGRYVKIKLTVYIGTPQLIELGLAMDYGTVSTPMPVNATGTELSAVAFQEDSDDRLILYPDPSFGINNMQIMVNGEILFAGDGYYANVEDGWNEILFNLLDPLTGETAITYTLHVYAGAEIPDGLQMTGVSGTYEGETTMDVGFAPSEEALTFSGWLAPNAASEMVLTPSVNDLESLIGVLYWNPNGQLEWAEQTSYEGSFILPIHSIYDSAFVVLKDEVGHSVVYEVQLEQPPYVYLTMKYESSPGNYVGSNLSDFGGTYWNVWMEYSGASRVYLEEPWESDYTYEIDGIPIDQFDFAPGGTPVPEGDNVYELTVSDQYGRSASYEFHLIREGNWTSNVTVSDMVVHYGNDETVEASLGTSGYWSKNWFAYLPAHTDNVTISFNLEESSTSALYDFWGKLIAEGTNEYSLSMDPLGTGAGYTASYYLVTKDTAGNRYLYPIFLNFEETEEPSNGLPNGIVGWSLKDANDVAHNWTATNDVAYFTAMNEETTSLVFHLDLEERYSVSLASVENGYLEADASGNYTLTLQPGYNEYYLYVTAPSEYTEVIYLYAIVGDITPELVASFDSEDGPNAADIYENGYMYWRPMDEVTDDTIQLAAFNFDTDRVYLDELYDDFDSQSITPTDEGTYQLLLDRNINRYTLYMSDVAGRTFQPFITIFYKMYERLNPQFEAGDGIVVSPYDSASRSWTAHIDPATQSGENQLHLNFADEGYYALAAYLSDPNNSGIIKAGENGTYILDFSNVSETVVNLKLAITYASGDLEEYTLTLDFTPTA
ncbi:cadherin-like beta sandwich domain-containing protein [Cohnella thailandensis]|uniref:Cadherin-like beta sandwich domain-containing protein n=1 Tax=Cohnella thailandensis TaxID=557557 RepID=A0A841T740_9BACL|nr:cadherin-like beta sandwich domain-containing protein [Cohnella thailandensis]MBB6638098.1 cadherin-like beta sandwich domain-containing protein [Cohnella thailandensis]MBP1971976.1 DNA-binding transcriptional MerR regulator [Cohnella thailandensis]